MTHNARHITSFLFILLLGSIGIGGRLWDFKREHTMSSSAFNTQFCHSSEIPHWSPAKRQLCGVGIFINSDPETALEYLPTVGPKRAAAIRQFRAKHGSFATPSDLTKVPGIGPVSVNKFQCWIEDLPNRTQPNSCDAQLK